MFDVGRGLGSLASGLQNVSDSLVGRPAPAPAASASVPAKRRTGLEMLQGLYNKIRGNNGSIISADQAAGPIRALPQPVKAPPQSVIWGG